MLTISVRINVLGFLGVAVNIPVYFPCTAVNTREQRVIPELSEHINRNILYLYYMFSYNYITFHIFFFVIDSV